MQPVRYPPNPQVEMKKSKNIGWIILGVCASIVVTCCIGGIAVSVKGLNSAAHALAEPTASSTVTTPPVDQPAGPVRTLPEPNPVGGSNDSVVKLNATLNGKYQVDYAATSFCMIVQFLKADGTSGIRWMEEINTCGTTIEDSAHGSTIITATDVTQIQVQNVHGDWSLTFTPIG